MLTDLDRSLLYEEGYCGYHEVQLGALVEGEPSLTKGILHYFDGRRLMICGYPLDRFQCNLADRVQAVVLGCLEKFPVEVIWYCGPVRASLRGIYPSRLRPMRTVRPLPTDAEMILDCSEPLHDTRLARWLRSKRSQQFTLCKYRPPDFKLRAEHYSMIESFYSSMEINPFLLDLAFKIPAMVTLQSVEWFEAWHGGKLVGFSAVIDAFRDMDIALFLTATRAASGASDFLYAAMRDASATKGKRYLNLGPSASDGHYAFKHKWGAQPQVPPYWWQLWGGGDLVHKDYDGWQPRLLQYGYVLRHRNRTFVRTRVKI